MYHSIQTKRYDWIRADKGLVAGICEGLAPNFGVSKWVLRFFWLSSAAIFGTGIVMYAICWLCLQKRSSAMKYEEPKALGGCLQISRRTGIEVGLVRCIVLALIPVSFGGMAIAYILISLLIPFRSPEIVFHGKEVNETNS